MAPFFDLTRQWVPPSPGTMQQGQISRAMVAKEQVPEEYRGNISKVKVISSTVGFRKDPGPKPGKSRVQTILPCDLKIRATGIGWSIMGGNIISKGVNVVVEWCTCWCLIGIVNMFGRQTRSDFQI